MIVPAKTPARRLLAIWPTKALAYVSAIEWAGRGVYDVRVEQGVKGTTDARPWGVTAKAGRP